MAHDPPTAWLIVIAYAIGAVLAFAASRPAQHSRERIFWLAAAAVLLALGLNKQLDLQSYVTSIGRDLARSQGWYEARRTVQGAFLLLLGVGAVGVAVLLAVWLRGAAASVKTAAAGLLILLAFVLVRAATFHHIDLWVTVDIAGMRRGRWLELELIGIAAVAAAAAAFRRSRTRAGSLTSKRVSG